MTRARMISIIVAAVLVVIGGGMYLLSQFGSPDYDAWRGDLVEVVDQAKVKLAEFDQIAVDANTKLSAYRERVQSIEAESGILSRRVADLSRVIQLAKGKLTRLGVLALRGREAVLGDGKKYTAEQLQALHTRFDMQVMQCVLVRDTMRGESRTARGAVQELQRRMNQYSEISRDARGESVDLNVVIKELSKKIDGPDDQILTTKKSPPTRQRKEELFARYVKDRREIIGNITESLAEVVRAKASADAEKIDIPATGASGRQARAALVKARQVAGRIGQLIR